MSSPAPQPMFPLQSALLPGEVLPLRIFEPRYARLVEDCLAMTEPAFGVVLITRGREVGGGDVQRRVHAHVERRIVGIREATLAAVQLHRRDAQVHVDDIDGLALEAGQDVREVALVEAALAWRRARHICEELRHVRVAVDRDEPAGGAE